MRVIHGSTATLAAITIYVAEPFPHNLALISVLYSGERPEITPHDEESEKAQHKQNQIKQRNKR
jgi:hypothetical protein